MKRIAAILLLGIFSFNLFGYKFIASYLESKENQRMETAFDNENYAENQLITIKQSNNLPYYSNSAEYQRVDGDIEIEGVSYKFVKYRIYNDSLELVCIPNTGKMKIQAAKADFSKLASDFQQNTEKKKSQSPVKVQKVLSDYEAFQQEGNNYCWKELKTVYAISNSHFTNSLFLQTAEQPPDFC